MIKKDEFTQKVLTFVVDEEDLCHILITHLKSKGEPVPEGWRSMILEKNANVEEVYFTLELRYEEETQTTINGKMKTAEEWRKSHEDHENI